MSGWEVTGLIVGGTVAVVVATAATAAVAGGTVWALMQIEARIQRRNRQRATR